MEAVFFMKRNRNMMMDYLIDDFMMYCKEKDLRPKTIFSYETTLRLFTRYIKDNFNIENITDVKEETVKDYISYTKERGKYTIISNKNTSYINIPKNRVDYGEKVSITTINNYIRNLKVFFTFCENERIIKKSLMVKIRQFKNNRKPKNIISDQDFKRLLNNIDTTKFSEFRDYVVI